MQKLYEQSFECFGCEACALICPADAIHMEADSEGFLYPKVEESRCTDCGRCRKVCPVKTDASSCGNRFFAVRCKDPELLYQSTSGGAFSLIASQILKDGGLVCGAAFDESFAVGHILSGEIAPMRKSKYIQSSVSGCFQQIVKTLDSGTCVLFSGTPCQCHAIRRCFPEEQNLITMALVCRGVMSPLLWEEYCRYLERKGKISAFCFRDKRRDDDAHTISCTVDGAEYTSHFAEHPLARIYIKELSLRPSCYHCPYTSPEKDFDFTVGDFWNPGDMLSEFADGKGLSLVITGSLRAEKILRDVSEEAYLTEVTKEDAVQPALCAPAKESMLRRFLFKKLEEKTEDGHCDMTSILKKYGF